ncbi:MAG: prenyltransferase/squalene oxidase repeat-containing protein [Planctomycetota bacterium]|jgi:biopolymer transport protein ExbD
MEDLSPDPTGGGHGDAGGNHMALAAGAAAAALLVAAVIALWHAGAPDGAKPEPEPAGPRVALTPLAGLGPEEVGPSDDGPPGAAKWLRKLTVTVPAEGEAEVTGVADASRWRGIGLPRDEGSKVIPKIVKDPAEIRVKIYWANNKGQVIYSDRMAFPADWPGIKVPLSISGAHVAMKINKLEIRQTPAGGPDLNELARTLRDLAARSPLPVVIDARSAVPFRWVMGALVACMRAGVRAPKFQAPPPPGGGGTEWWWGTPDDVRTAPGIYDRLKEAASRAVRDTWGLPNVCCRIRADANAPYGKVQGVMVAAMRAYVWRLSFVGSVDGKEVEIGPVYDAPDLPAAKATAEADSPVFVHDEFDLPGDIEHPVFVHEEVEVIDHVESETESTESVRGQEDVISDIPLGTGVVGSIGVGRGGAGTFGYRQGGGRKRAALRGGGNRSSEAAVDAALGWLARHQEPDGRWNGERKYEPTDPGADTDPGVTGLALLAFLGAGHTEKTGKFSANVRKGVAWLISQQAANGSIGDGFDGGLGYHHAIAGLALAEAFGMSRVTRTGVAAQKAVDYSTWNHQAPGSGWRYGPRQGADMSVTVWFVMQLKSAKVAGLKVDGGGFQGAVAFLEKCTKDGGLVSYQPERSATPTMTAAGMACRRFMGWTRTDPFLARGADYLAANLPQWGHGNVNYYYWYHGTLAMFQTGGHWWKLWNASLRDMLVERQRKGAAALDGSWDPVGVWCDKGGRVFSTAMGALCLEVYYRYLPLLGN